MFLQSYIYRATATLQWLSTRSTPLFQIAAKAEVEPTALVAAGMADLKQAIGTYCGMTCMGNQMSDVAGPRKAAQRVSDACTTVLQSLENQVPIGSAMDVSRRYRLPNRILDMERVQWNKWITARVLSYRGKYCRSFQNKLMGSDLSISPLKCIAKFNPAEGVAVSQTVTYVMGTWDAQPRGPSSLKWESAAEANISLSRVNMPYINIFEGDRVEEFGPFVLNYWALLAKKASNVSDDPDSESVDEKEEQ